MRIVTVSPVLMIMLLFPCGCSKESTRGALYESLRFKSNEINAPDPNYNPDDIPSYNEYRTQRDNYLEDRKLENERREIETREEEPR
jgi:hypothetical protein